MRKRENAWERLIREKREWRLYKRRVAALPADYRTVISQIETFMWNFAVDSQMIAVFEGILDLFEEGAAQGRKVLEVTGEDVAEFAKDVLAEVQAATWTGKKADRLNAEVHKRLARLETDD